VSCPETKADRPQRLLTVAVEGDMAVIRVPLTELHGLRVALHPCPCRAPKSIGTADIRERLARAITVIAAKV